MTKAMTTRKKTEGLAGRPVALPAVDIFEADEYYHLRADLPGVPADGLELRLDKGELVVEGRWPEEEPGDSLAREFRPVDFRRTFLLPDSIDAAGVSAELHDGVLEVRIPKSEAVKPKRISVKVS